MPPSRPTPCYFLGETQSFYVGYVTEFIHDSRHPRFDRPYARLYYQPMRQLIDFLNANGFAVYLVSGSQQGFTRGYGTDVLGLEAPRLVGHAVEMVQYATSSPYPSLGLIVVHDDPE